MHNIHVSYNGRRKPGKKKRKGRKKDGFFGSEKRVIDVENCNGTGGNKWMENKAGTSVAVPLLPFCVSILIIHGVLVSF